MKKKTNKIKKLIKSKVKPKAKPKAGSKPKVFNTNKSGIVPLNDRVLVKPFNGEEMATTSSGIIIPDTVSKEKPEQGTVVAVGKKVESGLKEGDKVVFSKYGYDEVKVKGEEYYILREENILAIIN